jgi:glutathione synthase/RimK-type ligase-like ATP-grasp enzyme
MRIIGVLFGMEQSFPPALVEAINSMNLPDVAAEFVKIGGVRMDELLRYDVILDRISHDIPFYRSVLKVATLGGTRVVNNPFWWSADDKFFGYALAARIGIPVPRTVIFPTKQHPPRTTSESMRNLIYPLNWEELFAYVGFPAYLKPHLGGGWRQVYKVHDPHEFFAAYDQTGDTVMVLQEAIEYEEYYRCFVIGEQVRVIPYEPRNPYHLRYLTGVEVPPERERQLRQLALQLCTALGYEINTVEFAVRDGTPYAIDFLNPAPDAERYSVQEENFRWIVQTTAEYLVQLALQGRQVPQQYHWSAFIGKAAPQQMAPAASERKRKRP